MGRGLNLPFFKNINIINMATYTITENTRNNDNRKFTFTGEAANTALDDQTAAFNANSYNVIMASADVVKAGTTDTATITLQGSNDGSNWYDLPDIASSPNDGTETSPSSAATHNLNIQYIIGGTNSAYRTPKYDQYRLAFTTSGTTDNKNIINGVIILKKND